MDAGDLPDPAAQRPNLIRRLAGGIARNIGFICVALVGLYCIVSAFDPPRLNWGDSMSDYNVMNSGRNFAHYGFLKLHLTPFLMDPAYMQADDRMFVYTHYPQLPDLMNGLLRKALGLTDIVQFRFVALLFSFASLFFVYRLLERYWGRRTAQIGLALWVVNPLWIQHADYLHHAPYGAFFGFGCLYLLNRFFDGGRKRYLALSGVCAFLVILASYDWWLFAPLLIAIVTVVHYRALFDRRAIGILSLLGACTVAGVAFKFATNVWGLGGLAPFLADLRFQYLERGTDVVTRNFYRSGILPTMYGRIERFFTLLLFPITALWLVAPLLRRSSHPVAQRIASVPNPILLLAAAIPFLYVFAEIWVGQYYPGLLVLPFYAVACAATIALLADAGPRGRLVAGVLFVALLLNSVEDTASFKKAFFRRETIRTLSEQLDQVSRRGQLVLVNHTFDGAYRYLFNRNSNAFILIPPGVSDIALAAYADPKQRPKSGTPDGAIFVEHKHVTDELYDKGFYYILARYKLWNMWANPPKYHAAIDTLITERNAVLMSKVAASGKKLFETDDYVIWRVKP